MFGLSFFSIRCQQVFQFAHCLCSLIATKPRAPSITLNTSRVNQAYCSRQVKTIPDRTSDSYQNTANSIVIEEMSSAPTFQEGSPAHAVDSESTVVSPADAVSSIDETPLMDDAPERGTPAASVAAIPETSTGSAADPEDPVALTNHADPVCNSPLASGCVSPVFKVALPWVGGFLMAANYKTYIGNEANNIPCPKSVTFRNRSIDDSFSEYEIIDPKSLTVDTFPK